MGGDVPLLFDVTRLVALRWSGRPANGIDRVSLEYLRHFGARARAVVQHRGVVRTWDARGSARLFELLGEDRPRSPRGRIAMHMASGLARSPVDVGGGIYLNVSHTDFDLPAHVAWNGRNGLHAVYLIHDLIPIRFPEHCRPHAVRRHTERVRMALLHGSGILVGSAAVEHDLREQAALWHLTPPPILRAPLAGAPLAATVPSTDATAGHFLCVGTIESRKNHRLLLDLWEGLRARFGTAAPHLIVVGRFGHGAEAFRRGLDMSGHAGGHITILEHCDDARLAALMRDARAVLMPTLAEGFGLPMAEALAQGVPVIASDLPALREVGQGLACLIEPGDRDGWEARIAAFHTDPDVRKSHAVALRAYRPTRWTDHFDAVERWMPMIAARAVANPPADRAGIGARTAFVPGGHPF
ncbi:glycosyltransferase family 1 protein [uncultured Croceicoccus sp.]|uniref:glycosyltransferase family 4 protein n=1 Tax=uncultured Croceicoccus sp. TaxID=1295329 RepID=UPI0026294349|nr:glycosyltransferase family 1 protein [uncultured Croceicoccus sp.]